MIDLSDNSLRTLEGQGLHTLRHLVKLNLARNQFASLDSVLDWLSPCHALKVRLQQSSGSDARSHSVDIKNVMLVDSTTDGRTKVIDSYLDIVGWRLRGVQYIDGNVNKDMLEGMQLDSQRQPLWLLCQCAIVTRIVQGSCGRSPASAPTSASMSTSAIRTSPPRCSSTSFRRWPNCNLSPT